VIDDDEFVRLFEAEDESYLQYLDLDNPRRPGMETRTMAFDLPKPEFDAVAAAAAKAGTTPQRLVATWVTERVRW